MINNSSKYQSYKLKSVIFFRLSIYQPGNGKGETIYIPETKQTLKHIVAKQISKSLTKIYSSGPK